MNPINNSSLSSVLEDISVICMDGLFDSWMVCSCDSCFFHAWHSGLEATRLDAQRGLAFLSHSQIQHLAESTSSDIKETLEIT